MNTPKLRRIKNGKIIPVLRMEPLYMFDGVDKGPETREGIQNLFREVVSPKPIASINFLPGTDLLVPVSSFMCHLEDLADIFSYDIHAPTDTELSGGYAFVENGVYVFGVEDESTILDTIEWELSIEQLIKSGRTLIRYSWDNPFDAWLENEQVLLWNKRKNLQYAVPFKDYQLEIRKATEELKKFAHAFVPIYASKLNVPDPYEAAIWNFSNRRYWFEEQSVAVG
jgi:hypothetical protein